MRSWEIWVEGYSATGECSGARFVGEAEGETFGDACRNWYSRHPSSTFSPERLTDWACRLFDNEADARRSFG